MVHCKTIILMIVWVFLYYKYIKYIVFVSIAHYNVSLPHFTCPKCLVSRTTSILQLITSDYWPATASCETLYNRCVCVLCPHETDCSWNVYSIHVFTSLLEQQTEFFGKILINFITK